MAGLKPDEFWGMTLREVALFCEGAVYRSIHLAWHIEAFARQKRLPPLDKVIGQRPREQSPDEQERILRSIFEPMAVNNG